MINDLVERELKPIQDRYIAKFRNMAEIKPYSGLRNPTSLNLLVRSRYNACEYDASFVLICKELYNDIWKFDK